MPNNVRLRRDDELPLLSDPLAAVPSMQMKGVPGESGATFYLATFHPAAGSAPITEFVVDPFTWGWVAVMIAEGVLQGLGTQIWNSVIGDRSRDFASFQMEVLARITAIVKAAIADEAKRRMEVDLYSLQSRFGMYVNNKDAAALPAMRDLADHIVFDAWTQRLPAVGSFAIVGGLELAILQELHARSKAKGDKTNVAEVAIRLWHQSFDFMIALGTYNMSRFSPLFVAGLTGGLTYLLDGNRQPPIFASEAQAARIREEHIEREYRRLEQDILAPMYPAAEKWREIALKNGWQPAPTGPK